MSASPAAASSVKEDYSIDKVGTSTELSLSAHAPGWAVVRRLSPEDSRWPCPSDLEPCSLHVWAPDSAQPENFSDSTIAL